jgi:hypothetical protein
MFVTIQQTRLFLAAIGVVAGLVLALDLARVADHPRTAPKTSTYVGIPRHTPGSTARFRVAYRATLVSPS